MTMIDSLKLKKSEQQNIIARAMAYESEWDGYESENVTAALDDLMMENGDAENGNQWEKMKGKREGRLMLTVNKLGPPVKRIVNEFRQNSIAIKVKPQESDDKTIARVRQGLIKNIENVSNAKAIYTASFDSAVKCSFGYFRALADYKSYSSFDQDLKIEMIPNAFAVKMDFRRKWVWGHDAKWCLINDELSHDDFKNQFPNAEMSKEGFNSKGLNVDWYSQKSVKIVEFFECRYDDDIVYMLKDGTSVLASKYKGSKRDINTKKEPRATKVPKIHWYKLTCTEVLDHSILPIQHIPIICMPGDVTWIKDKRYTRSLIRFAKDSQRSFNLNKSNAYEKNGLAPKAPWVLTAEQVKGYEDLYMRANVDNQPYLLYNGDPKANGAPQRQGYINVSAGDERLAMEDAEDIKTTTGVYDPALGAQSNETSGRAILARSGQSQTINYNFHDNAAMAVQYCGLILNEWIPYVYDGERTVRILGEGEKDEIVKLNSSDPNDPFSKFSEDDELYDVTVDVGAAFQTQMQEAFEAINELIPNMNQAQKDFSVESAVGNLNFLGADKLKNVLGRLNKKMYADIVEDEVGVANKKPDDPEVLKAELVQANDTLDKYNEALQMSEQVLSQLQEQLAKAQNDTEKQIVLEKIRHENKMKEIKFLEASKMKLKEMDNLKALEVPLMQNLIQTGSQALALNTAAAPAYAEQELVDEYNDDNGVEQEFPQMGVDQYPEMPQGQGMAQMPNNVPMQSSSLESPEMEQMQ